MTNHSRKNQRTSYPLVAWSHAYDISCLCSEVACPTQSVCTCTAPLSCRAARYLRRSPRRARTHSNRNETKQNLRINFKRAVYVPLLYPGIDNFLLCAQYNPHCSVLPSYLVSGRPQCSSLVLEESPSPTHLTFYKSAHRSTSKATRVGLRCAPCTVDPLESDVSRLSSARATKLAVHQQNTIRQRFSDSMIHLSELRASLSTPCNVHRVLRVRCRHPDRQTGMMETHDKTTKRITGGVHVTSAPVHLSPYRPHL